MMVAAERTCEELRRGSAGQPSIGDITVGDELSNGSAEHTAIDSADRASVAQPGERRALGQTTSCMATSLDWS